MLGKPPNKYCFLIGQTLGMSSLYETHIGDVIILCFLVLKHLQEFSCSSHQNKAHQVRSIRSLMLSWLIRIEESKFYSLKKNAKS